MKVFGLNTGIIRWSDAAKKKKNRKKNTIKEE